MSLTYRLILMVTISIGLAILGLATILGLLARDNLLSQAEKQAELVANIIASSANRAGQARAEIDNIIANNAEAQAIAIGHLTEVIGKDKRKIVTHLSEITADSTIDEILVLDPEGHAIAHVNNGHAFDAPEFAAANFDTRELDVLISGRRFSMVLRSLQVDEAETELRYLGARSRSGSLVLVGSHENKTEQMFETFGVSTMLSSLARQPEIEAIYLVNEQLRVTDFARENAPDHQATTTELTATDRSLANSALRSGARSHLSASTLHVAAPVLDRGGVATGAAVLNISRNDLDALFANHLKFGGIGTLVAFLIGSIIAILTARPITRPVRALTHAAEEMDGRVFRPGSLDKVGDRRDELGRLIRVFQTMARDVMAREEHLEALVRERTIDLEQKNEQLNRAHQRMEEELSVAHSLQGAILPKTLPQHHAYAGHAVMTPARELGGDFYDFFTLPDGRLGLVIADVSGKGVPAAFFMAIARTVMGAAAREYEDAGTCLKSVNDAICAQNPLDMFVTLFYGILETDTGLLTYANAGHNPPFLITRDGSVETIPTTGGVAIGVMPGLPYSEAQITLRNGETIFLYTDGISEAMNEDGGMFEETRMQSTLEQGNEVPVETLIDNITVAVKVFAGQAEQSDDITCVVLRYLGNKA